MWARKREQSEERSLRLRFYAFSLFFPLSLATSPHLLLLSGLPKCMMPLLRLPPALKEAEREKKGVFQKRKEGQANLVASSQTRDFWSLRCASV